MNNNSNIKYLCLQLTTACNFDCIYCYFGNKKGSEMMNQDIAAKAISWFLDIARKENFSPTIIFFGGEPLLNFDILRFVIIECRRYESNGYPATNFVITTNGYLLDRETSDFLCKEKVKISVSLDGDKWIQEYQRKSNKECETFDRIVENCKYLYSINGNIAIKATLTKKSILTIDNDIDFFEKNKIPYRLSPALFNNDKNKLALDQDDIDKIVKKECSIFERNISSMETSNNIGIFEFVKMFYSGNPTLYPCKAGISYIAIDTNGNFFPCHRFLNQKEYQVGNIYEKIKFEKLNLFVGSTVNERSECKECDIAILCGGYCYYESLFGSRTYCQFKKTKILNLSKLIFRHFERINSLLAEKIGKFNGGNNISFLKEINMNDKEKHDTLPFSLLSRKKNIGFIDLDESGILFFNSNKYIVNTTALAIWDLLDGQRNAQQIAQEIASVCEVDFEAIKDDIYGQLAAFQELGLVEEVQAESHA